MDMGKNDGPPDSQIKASMVYPGMVKKLDRAINSAQSAFQGGYNYQPLLPGQQGALGGIDAALSGPSPLGSPIGYASEIGSGYSDPTTSGLRSLGFDAGSYGGAGGTELNALLGQAMGSGGDLDYARATASGDFLTPNNPYAAGVIDAANRKTTMDYNDTISNLEGRLSQAGQFSGGASPIEQELRSRANLDLATGLSENASRVMYGDYAQERGYQQAAGMGLPGLEATSIGTGINAAGAVQGNSLANLNARLQALTAAGNAGRSDVATGLGAGGQLGSMLTGEMMPYTQGYGVEEQARNTLEQQGNSNWTSLQKYLSLLQQVNGNVINPAGGTQLQQGAQSSQQQTMGDLLAAAGIAAMFLA
jgi:hypothetical protein